MYRYKQKGFTPLHEACAEGHISVVYLLLAFGAVVMARSRDGWTGLMSAAYNGNVLVAKALLAAGSDINAKNKVLVTYIPYLPTKTC